MRRIFSGVIGDRGIEPGRAVLGGVAALSESKMIVTDQVLRYAGESQVGEKCRVGLCSVLVGDRSEWCECCRGDNLRRR